MDILYIVCAYIHMYLCVAYITYIMHIIFIVCAHTHVIVYVWAYIIYLIHIIYSVCAHIYDYLCVGIYNSAEWRSEITSDE